MPAATPSAACVLVGFAGTHGSTAEIAEAIAAELRRGGLRADCRPAGDVKDLRNYDAVVPGSAVYMKRWWAAGIASSLNRSIAAAAGS